MYIVNGSDGRCLVAVRLIVGVRYLERPLREVLLYIYILVNATALGLAYPAARQMACTSCSVGISDLKPLTGTSADQLPHTKSRSLATA